MYLKKEREETNLTLLRISQHINSFDLDICYNLLGNLLTVLKIQIVQHWIAGNHGNGEIIRLYKQTIVANWFNRSMCAAHVS